MAKTYAWPDGSKNHTIPYSKHQSNVAAKQPAKPYKWPDGSKHTIPYQHHQQNVQAKQYGINLDAPLAGPLDNRTAYGMAEAAAGRVYDPQIQAAQDIERSAPSWYQNYITKATAAQDAVKAYADPLVQAAQVTASQPAVAAPGVDPGSPAYAASQQAGQSGQNLAALGAATLAAIPLASQAYIGGQQSIAARDQPATMAYLGKQVGQLKGARGQATVEQYGQLRTGEQNADIARSTLNLNTAKTQAQIDLDRGIDPTTGKPLPKDPEKPITSGAFAGLTASQVNALTPEQKQTYVDNYNAVTHPPKAPGKDPNELTPAQKRAAAKAKAKHKTDVTAATGKIRGKITDIIDVFTTGGMTDDTNQKPDPVTGKYPQRKATPAEMRNLVATKYKTLGRIALAIHEGKKLTSAQVDYLHGLDPNFRVPREWISDRTQAQNPSGTSQTPTRAPGGAHGHI